jgi:hypothetical protein
LHCEQGTGAAKEGTTYFFSGEKSREIRVETPVANGAIRGTEFVVAVAANGSATVTKDSNETTLISNDDWQQGQPVEIQNAGLAPADPRESRRSRQASPQRLSSATTTLPVWHWRKCMRCRGAS